MEKLFTLKDTWSGGHYELALDLGEQTDEGLWRVLGALWAHPTLEGCYLQRDVEPEQQRRIDFASSELSIKSALYGVAHLPNGKEQPVHPLSFSWKRSQIGW